MKAWHIGLVLALAATVLVGCGGGEATSEPVDEGVGETYTSAVLDTSYPDAVSVSNQLALGTIQLEEPDEQHPMDHAVTSEQAAALLPLWRAIQSGALKSEAEMNAVLSQIEGTMTEEQLAAIARLQLTQEDLRAWMQEQGLSMGGFPGAGGEQGESPEPRATRQAEFGGGEMPPEMGGGEMPPEMATRRAEFAQMSGEQRTAMRATVQAGGGIPGGPGGRGGAGGRQFIILLDPLIELLEARAGEA